MGRVLTNLRISQLYHNGIGSLTIDNLTKKKHFLLCPLLSLCVPASNTKHICIIAFWSDISGFAFGLLCNVRCWSLEPNGTVLLPSCCQDNHCVTLHCLFFWIKKQPDRERKKKCGCLTVIQYYCTINFNIWRLLKMRLNTSPWKRRPSAGV